MAALAICNNHMSPGTVFLALDPLAEKKNRNWFDENVSQNSRITAIVTAAFPAVTASLPPIYTVVSFCWCNFKRAAVTSTLACIILSSISNPLSTFSPFSDLCFRKSRLNQAGSILITLSTAQMENLVDRSSLSLSYTWEAKAISQRDCYTYDTIPLPAADFGGFDALSSWGGWMSRATWWQKESIINKLAKLGDAIATYLQIWNYHWLVRFPNHYFCQLGNLTNHWLTHSLTHWLTGVGAGRCYRI